MVNLWGSYRFEQENKLGGGVRWRVPLGVQGLELTGEASRATRTNDAWIRGDVANSVRALVLGRDYRDYWDADVLRVMVDRPVGKPLDRGGDLAGAAGRHPALQRPRAAHAVALGPAGPRGAGAGEPRGAGGDHRLAAGRHALSLARARPPLFDGDLNLEHALDAPGGEFTQALFLGDYRTRALRTHQLQVYLRAMAPLGGNDAPPQRRGILGGGGTFPRSRSPSFAATTWCTWSPATSSP